MWCIQTLAAFFRFVMIPAGVFFDLVDEKSILFCLWLRKHKVLDHINVPL